MRSKVFIICGLFSILFSIKKANAQTFDFSLTGNPVDITDWVLGSQSSIDGEEIILTNPIGDQNGYIYYETPQDLASCSEFTVEFEFRITNSSSPTADGIAFFYITQPPSGFIQGEGIGLPSNPEGLILVLDTYDNDNNNNNPLVSLRNMPGNVNYIEGNAANNIVADLTNQSFISDGHWHTCVLHYNVGEVSVRFDGQAPVLVGNTSLNIVGYFGFSSSAGGSWAKHAIKNVHIYGAGTPPKPDDVTFEYCQNEIVNDPLDIPGDNLEWFLSPTGGSPLPGAPIPNTQNSGIFTYYVAETVPHCNLESERAEIKVIVHPKAMNPVVNIPSYCSGQTSTQSPMVVNSSSFQWYANADKTGPFNAPFNVNTSVAGNNVYYVENISAHGCPSDLVEVIVPIHQSPDLDFDWLHKYNCDLKDSIYLVNLSNHTDSFFWYLNDTLFSQETQPKLQIEYPETHEIKLIGKNEYCENSLIKEITTGHHFEVDFEAEPYYFCHEEVILFTNTSSTDTIGNLEKTATWYVDGEIYSTDWDFEVLLPYARTYEITLVVKNELGCEKSITKEIEIDPILNPLFALKDTSICLGENIILERIEPDARGLDSIVVRWGDNTQWTILPSNYSDLQHAYTQNGSFTIEIESYFRACPTVSEVYNVYVEEMPIVRFLSAAELCLHGEEIHLENQEEYRADFNYKWSTGDTTAYTKAKKPGRFTLEISNKYCTASEFIDIEKDCFINIPNAFSPNGDGENDYFIPREVLSKGVTSFEMEVYNRWGQKVFATQQINGRGWDGKYNDVEQPMGVYVYKIQVTYKNGRTEEYTGNVTLVR